MVELGITGRRTKGSDQTTDTALQTSRKVLDEAYRVLAETQHLVRPREEKRADDR